MWKKPKFQKSCHAENTARNKKKTSPLNELKLQGSVSLVKRIPKEKTRPRCKRQLLILVLPGIRRTSLYQRVIAAQKWKYRKMERKDSTKSQVREHTIKVYSNLSCYIHADLNKWQITGGKNSFDQIEEKRGNIPPLIKLRFGARALSLNPKCPKESWTCLPFSNYILTFSH